MAPLIPSTNPAALLGLPYVPDLSSYLRLGGAWLLVLILAVLTFAPGLGMLLRASKSLTRIAMVVGVIAVVALYAIHLRRAEKYHLWDFYHTSIGSKYLPELGYGDLYDCTYRLAYPKDGTPMERRSMPSSPALSSNGSA